ncbi:hypothetical protein [Burkholderia multivorans]|uniref:hypothetical protein n=1 Tax=Burkholderia multivorans TaxID=87883 RepID=UPI001C277E71|nr:hypothetical protein [Burkholderia multivorans]MBU9337261.1 hypothetical protein [Burkholderia multivorans]MCA8480150.1 hypothetical protein [Burkholderia multivorans]
MLFTVGLRCFAGVLLTFAGATLAHAADVSIVSEYVPGMQAQPGNGFHNVTRAAGFCAADSGGCTDLTTIDLPVGDVSYGALAAGAGGQDAVYFRGPAGPVRVELRDERTNRTTSVSFRATGIVGQYTLHPDVNQLAHRPEGNAEAAHAALWEGGGWQHPPAGCTALSVQPMATPNAYRFGWRLPRDAGGGCFKVPRHAVPAGALVLDGNSLAVAYELVTPDPVALPNGIYRGVRTFTVGPGQDFDFGSHAQVARPTVDVEFVLKVRHQFMITDAGAGREVDLAPPQGWLGWIAEGKPASRIDRDVAFGLSTGEPLRVSLRCEDGEDPAGRCVIRNARNSVVPVDLSLSVTGAFTGSQTPFAKIPLTTRAPVSLEVTRYLDNAPAMAHVSVDGAGLSEMGRNPGTTYTGRVSIVFDAISE